MIKLRVVTELLGLTITQEQRIGAWRTRRFLDTSEEQVIDKLKELGWVKSGVVDMILHCPECHMQHVDGPDFCRNSRGGLHSGLLGDRDVWSNPPHRSHRCGFCGFIWRPADVPTNGVQAIKSRGKNDST